MKIINEKEIAEEKFPAPFARTIKHLAAPWTLGTKNLWLGIALYEVGSSSNPHHHEIEEIFYVIEGEGRIQVGEETQPIFPGMCIYVPSGFIHQLINTGTIVLKVLAVTSPPFTVEKFSSIHQ